MERGLGGGKGGLPERCSSRRGPWLRADSIRGPVLPAALGSFFPSTAILSWWPLSPSSGAACLASCPVLLGLADLMLGLVDSVNSSSTFSPRSAGRNGKRSFIESFQSQDSWS